MAGVSAVSNVGSSRCSINGGGGETGGSSDSWIVGVPSTRFSANTSWAVRAPMGRSGWSSCANAPCRAIASVAVSRGICDGGRTHGSREGRPSSIRRSLFCVSSSSSRSKTLAIFCARISRRAAAGTARARRRPRRRGGTALFAPN